MPPVQQSNFQLKHTYQLIVRNYIHIVVHHVSSVDILMIAVHASLYAGQSVWLSVHASVHPSVWLSVRPYVCPYVFMSVLPSVALLF